MKKSVNPVLTKFVLLKENQSYGSIHSYEAFEPPKIGHIFEVDDTKWMVHKLEDSQGKNIHGQKIVRVFVFKTPN